MGASALAVRFGTSRTSFTTLLRGLLPEFAELRGLSNLSDLPDAGELTLESFQPAVDGTLRCELAVKSDEARDQGAALAPAGGFC